MRFIDMENWSRRRHFEVYRRFDYPHFSLCAPVDVTAFLPAVQQASVSFTSMMHPTHLHPVDSVPRIAWGKFGETERREMPLSVQVHHGLMDGIHVGRYFYQVQDILDRPQFLYEP